MSFITGGGGSGGRELTTANVVSLVPRASNELLIDPATNLNGIHCSFISLSNPSTARSAWFTDGTTEHLIGLITGVVSWVDLTLPAGWGIRLQGDASLRLQGTAFYEFL